jgi:hypothetical protein
MPSSARAVFIEPDAWDRTAPWWFTVVAAGSAVGIATARCGDTHVSTATRDHRALTKKLGLLTLKRLDAFCARRP